MALLRYEQLLEELSPWEKTMLKRWLSKHLSDKQRYLLPLLECLGTGLSPEEIWQAVFPDQAYVATLFHRRVNLLFEYSQEFLLFEQVIRKRAKPAPPYERERLWLAHVQRLEQPDLLLAAYRQLENKLAKQPILARVDLDLLALQEAMEGALIHQFQKSQPAEVPRRLPYYHELRHIQHLQGQVLQLAELMVATGKELPPHYESERAYLLSQIGEHPEIYQPYPLLWFGYRFLQMLDLASFPEFLASWQELRLSFVSLYEQAESDSSHLQNSYRFFQPVILWWRGTPGVAPQQIFESLWKYYSWGAQSGALFVDGTLPPTTFRNLAAILIRLYQEEPQSLGQAVPKELITWREALSPTQQTDLWPITVGMLAFQREKYVEAITTFQEVPSDAHPVYLLTARVYLCMALFEWWHHSVEHTGPEKQFYAALQQLKSFLQYRSLQLPLSLHTAGKSFAKAIELIFLGKFHPKSAVKLEAILTGTPQPLMVDWLKKTYQEVQGISG